ncbi:molybdate ABC transporter substrate-binding protein [Brockia lithotrophica]|uniref:molybdate ABC transporter substrate-binding protein n=1 Tax=Brockia lithotrophica TaxID=933949 RepID=UPI000EAF1878|nr:molybdate ABC transporter substrate-binding protein [Brockia lithotrophica]
METARLRGRTPRIFRPRSALVLAVALFTLLALSLGGCGGKAAQEAPPSQEAKAPTTLTVSAAISLKDALTELKGVYEKDHPNVKIDYNFGASGNLKEQILSGASVDVFLSVGKKEIDELKDKNYVDQGRVDSVATNRLVLIAPKDGGKPATFRNLPEALGAGGKLALGEPKSVPAGRYAEQALKAAGVWDAVKDRIVYAQTVRQVLAYVESGEANYGVVYATDAKISDKVTVVDTADSSWHDPIHYLGVVLANSQHKAEAAKFLDFLLSPEAQKVFAKYGFSPGAGRM